MSRRISFLLIAGLLLFIGGPVFANPSGPQVVHGQAGFSFPDPRTLDITNSSGAIINWQGFSIRANEVTRFIQPSSRSAVLNRVVGPDPSALFGGLYSNGKVFLINPHGMVFGPDCVIDTAGFVAATLNITDEDFLAGNLRFEGNGDSGAIVNQGLITAGKNGDILLIAPNIENSGVIRTEEGNILLAAGGKVTLTGPGIEGLHFEVQAPKDRVLNLGKIRADGGAVGIFAGTLRHTGEIRADTVTRDETGIIILSASDDITLEPNGIISASGAPGGVRDGGEVRIIAQDTLDLRGGAAIHVDGGPDGGNGGFLELSGKQKIALNGAYTGTAKAAGYRNGSLLLDPADINISTAGPDDTGGDGIITAPESPGTALYIDPSSLDGAWTDVSLAATNDINIQSPVADTDIPSGGSLRLYAGNDINVNAAIGTATVRFDHDLFFTAGNNIDINSSVYLSDRLFSARATDISFDAPVDTGPAGTLKLMASGGVTQTASLAAGTAELLGTGSYSLNDAGNRISVLRVDTGSADVVNQTDTYLAGVAHAGAGDQATAAGQTPVANARIGTAIARDGDVMVVGAAYENSQGNDLDGAVYIYRWNGSAWVFEQKLISPDPPTGDGFPDRFGNSVAVEGNLLVVGAPERTEPGFFRHGAAYAYHYNGSNWVLEEKIGFSKECFENHFGDAVDIDNGRLVVGGNGRTIEGGFWTGRIWFFDYVPGTGWVERGDTRQSNPVGNDYFGSFLDIQGDRMIVGAPSASSAGKAYIFKYDPASHTWLETQKLTASDAATGDKFGFDVALKDDVAAIGTNGAEAAYVFRYNGSAWQEEQILTASDHAAGDVFGYKVSVDDGVVAVSSHGHEVGPVTNAGAVYLYEYDGGAWQEERQATAAVPEANAYFGRDVLLDSNRLFVGSLYADQGAVSNAGKVFVINPLNTSDTAGAFGLAATGDIHVSAPLRGGGPVTLSAGDNITVDAPVGTPVTPFTHDFFMDAGNDILVNAGISLADNALQVNAGNEVIVRDAVVETGPGGSFRMTNGTALRIQGASMDASITTGTVDISAGTLEISASNGPASLESNGTMTITVGGNMSVTGGTGAGAYAAVDPPLMDLTVGGNLTVDGGAGNNAPAFLSADVTNVHVTGDTRVSGGAGYGSYGLIGASAGDVTVETGGLLSLLAGTATDADAVIEASAGTGNAYLTYGTCTGCANLTSNPFFNGATEAGVFAATLQGTQTQSQDAAVLHESTVLPGLINNILTVAAETPVTTSFQAPAPSGGGAATDGRAGKDTEWKKKGTRMICR